MDKIQEMLCSINEIKERYSRKDNFSVFTALHKERDEVNLHSRFISYLLSPISEHGMKNVFLNIFVRDILKLKDAEFDLSNCVVIPNEFKKKEEDEIDIFIKNKKKQAIIIENKIDARDSNHEDEHRCGYKGQLERYYNETKDKNYSENHIFVFFLTLYRDPSVDSIGMLKDKPNNWRKIIWYDKEIRVWLEKCLKEIPTEKSFVKEFVQQYLNLINKMTNNDINIKERLELKEKVAENWESAQYLITNFKHVKWHTVHDFWVELKEQLEKTYQILSFPDIEKITAATHQKNKGNIENSLVLNFKKIENEQEYYVANDCNGLTYSKFTDKSNYQVFSDKIRFFEFSNEETFKLVNKAERKNVITELVSEINEFTK